MPEPVLVLPRNEAESHSEYAYRVIRENIMSFRLEPDSLLNENVFADAMRISRTPVHEAVLRLKDENLIEVIPRRESKVSRINLSLANEGAFMRCAIEPAMIRQIAGNIPRAYVDRFQRVLEQQKGILGAEGQLYYYTSADDEFHRLIYEVANKPVVYSSVRKIIGHLDRIRYLIRFNSSTEIESATYEEHRQFFSVMMFGIISSFDIDTVYRNHILRFQNSIPMLRDKYPNYFTFT